MNKVIPLLAFSILLLVPAGLEDAYAVEQIDQQTLSIGNEVTGSACPGGNVAIQSFAPTVTNLSSIEAKFSAIADNTYTVELSVSGPGLSEGSTVESISTNPQLVKFSFNPPLVLSPGQQYEIFALPNCVDSSDVVWHAFDDPNSYPFGQGTNVDLQFNQGIADFDFIFTTFYDDSIPDPDPDPNPITCGPKTTLNAQNQCIPVLSQICGSGTTPDFNAVMCFATNLGSMIGGELLNINTVSLLVASIGTNPIITGLVGITLAGVAGQAVWFVHRRRKSE